MKARLSIFLSSLFIFLLFPFLCTFFFHGTQACTLLQPANSENFLPYLLSLQIHDDQKIETLKAQAVLARTNLTYQESQGKSLREILQTSLSDVFATSTWYRIFFPSNRYHRAVTETSGQILTYEDDFCLTPYHQVSCGKTRNGQEVFHNSSFSYLQSVDSSQDLKAPDYLTQLEIPARQLPDSLEIQQTDSSGYILTLTADDDTVISGERFRKEFQLASSCLSIQDGDNIVKILCKGQGHGLGLSQYGAEYMAREGNTYDEILLWYFPALALTTVPA